MICALEQQNITMFTSNYQLPLNVSQTFCSLILKNNKNVFQSKELNQHYT